MKLFPYFMHWSFIWLFTFAGFVALAEVWKMYIGWSGFNLVSVTIVAAVASTAYVWLMARMSNPKQ